LTSANADTISTEDSQTTLSKILNPPHNTTLLEAQVEDEKSMPDAAAAAVPDEKRLGLREILISNYDPKFATKIGIKDFVPIQVMASHMEGDKDLDFIPFEDIDHSYPK
jgi:hypothetical protein